MRPASSPSITEGLVDPHGEGRPPPRGKSIKVKFKSMHLFHCIYSDVYQLFIEGILIS